MIKRLGVSNNNIIALTCVFILFLNSLISFRLRSINIVTIGICILIFLSVIFTLLFIIDRLLGKLLVLFVALIAVLIGLIIVNIRGVSIQRFEHINTILGECQAIVILIFIFRKYNV